MNEPLQCENTGRVGATKACISSYAIYTSGLEPKYNHVTSVSLSTDNYVCDAAGDELAHGDG